MKRAKEITIGFFNGKKGRYFKLYELEGNSWVFKGSFFAPFKVAKKHLVKWVESQGESK